MGKFTIGFGMIMLVALVSAQSSAGFIANSASGNVSAEVTIFGDPTVSDTDSDGGIAPWSIDASLSVSGDNGFGNASASVDSEFTPLGLFADGNYNVYAGGFAGGTFAVASLSYSASFSIDAPVAYTLQLSVFGVFFTLQGPGLDFSGFDTFLDQSGVLEPGDYFFGASASGSGSGGNGTGGGFSIDLQVPSPGAGLVMMGSMLGCSRRRRYPLA